MKETYGVEVGDKITCHWDDYDTDKVMKITGIVYAIDHDDNFSEDVATFRLINYKKVNCWFCGLPTRIVKAKDLVQSITSTPIITE